MFKILKMKKIYLLLFAFCFFTANSQIITFTDANFKAKLLEANTTNTIARNLAGNYFKIDANNNSQIEQSEASKVKELVCSFSSISNLNEINFFNVN